MAPSNTRRLFARALALVRASWLVAGCMLGMLMLLEGAVRAEHALTAGPDRSPEALASGDPRAALTWYPQYFHDFLGARSVVWKSYVYFRRSPSYHSRYVNIDQWAHRITPQPVSPAVPDARVFFFGGSTMWGNAQRDSMTIAAVAARRLQGLARPGGRIEVTNFGENGYVTTQEVIELELQLRSGNRPDVAVFYDGINDPIATVMWGAPGVPHNETKRVAEFALGRALDRTGADAGLRKDVRAMGLLGVEAFNHLDLVSSLRALLPRPAPAFIPADSGARATVRTYAENVRLVEALAAKYGFRPIYVWQPTVQATRKPLTPYERRITSWIKNDAFQRRIRDVDRAIPSLIDSAMAGISPGRFINATTLFDADSAHVFVDIIGHTMEAANDKVVDSFWEPLVRALRERPFQRQLAVQRPAAESRLPVEP